MNKFQLVVFDMAGTTVQDKGNVAAAFVDAFKQAGLKVPTEEVNKVMGFRKRDAIDILLEKFHSYIKDKRDLIERIHNNFTRNMIRFYESDIELRPLPHAAATFAFLKSKGIKVALNTGFTKAITETILKKLRWHVNDKIDYIISSDEVAQGRPYPDMITKIMEAVEVKDAKQVVKVGDTEVDVEEGRNAGCGMVVSVTTGAYTRKQLEMVQPDFIISNLKELRNLIQ